MSSWIRGNIGSGNGDWTCADVLSITWWRHQMKTFSALLSLYAGNSPVTGEFPPQRPVTRSSDISLICAWTNGWANNRDAGDLRRHRARCDVTVMIGSQLNLCGAMNQSQGTLESSLQYLSEDWRKILFDKLQVNLIVNTPIRQKINCGQTFHQYTIIPPWVSSENNNIWGPSKYKDVVLPVWGSPC